MTRGQRERAILALIQEQPVETQQELVDGLMARGLEVTQATVSRDIKRLGLVKTPLPNGRYRYASPVAAVPGRSTTPARGFFQSFVLGLDAAEAFLLVRTRPGHASAVASAIDEMRVSGVAGTLAGDDTVLVMVRHAVERGSVQAELEKLL